MIKQRDALLIRHDNSRLRTYVVDIGGGLDQPLLLQDYSANAQRATTIGD
jgi:hypothetical protein